MRERRGTIPIFEVRFALQNHPIPDVALPGLSAKLRMRSTGTARFHLACEITEEAEQLEVVWLFRPKSLSAGGGGKPWAHLPESCSPVPAARPKPASPP